MGVLSKSWYHLGTTVAGAAVVLGLAVEARAATVADTAGDFLGTYIGPQNGDMDILSAGVSLGGGAFNLDASVAADIGTTVGGGYVFGFDRGQGTARFAGATPSIGTGVLFDLVVVISKGGTSFVRDLLANVTTNLGADAVSFDGTALSAVVDAKLLPGTGFGQADFTYNLWTRNTLVGGTNTIADFAPDNSNASVSPVPLPAALPMLAGAVALLGAAGARRRKA